MARFRIDVCTGAVALLPLLAGCGESNSASSSGGGGASTTGTGGSTTTSTTDSTSTTAGSGGGTTGGIAQKYPGDQGIILDPDVLFFDDFESYNQAADLWIRWDNSFQADQTRIATEPGNFYAGKQAVEFTLPHQDAELSNAVQKILAIQQDSMHLRWYSKFEGNNDITGSSHNGGGMSAHYFVGNMATPGVPADGTNKFLMEFEHWRDDPATPSPGALNVYIYHPEQRSNYGDHFFPTGLVMPNTSIPFDFGPDFVPQPDIVPDLDRWYCYEMGVTANTPGQYDGRITLWLDGKQIADFTHLRLRDVDTLKIDRFNVGFHAGANPGPATRKWYDNVVAAKSYIGPMAQP